MDHMYAPSTMALLPSSFQKLVTLPYKILQAQEMPAAAIRRSILPNPRPEPTQSANIHNILTKSAIALELRFAIPGQTLEEAENRIPIHAQSLLKVKDLLMAESWVEAQKALKKSSSYLKQDLYTIIQGKPAKVRQQLRKLYVDLFNAVTRLDYAARIRIGFWYA